MKSGAELFGNLPGNLVGFTQSTFFHRHFDAVGNIAQAKKILDIGKRHIGESRIVLKHAGLKDSRYPAGLDLGDDAHGGEWTGRGNKPHPVIDTDPRSAARFLPRMILGTRTCLVLIQIVD